MLILYILNSKLLIKIIILLIFNLWNEKKMKKSEKNIEKSLKKKNGN